MAAPAAPDAAPDADSGPLAGLRIVEMAGLGPCPLAGQMLADLGAEVIVVERRPGPPRPHDVNNRGKRSLVLDLKTAPGIAAALRLIDRSDALIEGFRPGVMERLGLGPEICAARNPRLVYGRMTGWGQDGPLAPTAGHDINYLSLTGALWMMGRRDQPPSPPLNLVADYGGGTMLLLFGVMAALWERARSGRGQVVDAAMVDGVSAFTGIFRMMNATGRWRPAREANMLDGGAPFYRCYETADGGYMAVGALEPQFFAELAQKAGLPDADRADQHDPRGWPEKSARYAALFRTRTRAEWEALFAGTDACATPVLSPDEAFAHPHNRARATHVEVEGLTQAAPAPRFARTPAPPPRPPVAAGADTAAILSEMGYTSDEISTLGGREKPMTDLNS